MTNRPTIALAMIVKNEAENLPGLIESVQGAVDKIYITDTGSDDNTVEVAKSLGCVVRHFDWIQDFSAARNASFQGITEDYILWMDGDDILEGKNDFIRFRDEIMHISDYWVANYIYASHPDGSPACTFIRERVVKNTPGNKWKYFVHEGMTPPPGAKVQFVPSWRIRHRRTNEDLAKDRSRNLSIFDHHKNKLDTRMTFYYGKELFENQKMFECCRPLEDALAKTDMEIHDRTLAMQYLCMAYLALNQFPRAYSLALTGIQLAPLRAEFFSLAGDACLKMNQFQNAIPFYEAATHCPANQSLAQGNPVFNHVDCYTHYPLNQLARIYANMGNPTLALSKAKESVDKYKNPESQQLVDELSRITTVLDGKKDAKPCEDIVFTGHPTGPYVWDGEEYRTKGMGGSETACIEMAEHMAKLSGRKVVVFNARADQKMSHGVEYRPVGLLNQYMAEHKPYLHIAWRHNTKLTDAPTFAWCHDLITPGIEESSNRVRAICLTPFHADFMHNMQLVPYEEIWVSRNGIRPERFAGAATVKNPNKVVFPSSPDRGLDRAILVMDEVRKEFPEAELHVFYGIEHLPQWGHQPLHDKLVGMMKTRPWVKYHGKTEQKVLHQHFKEAAVWLHPCDFIETSCITAMEMIASGVYPVTRRLGGLKDTLKSAEEQGLATLLNHDCVSESEFRAYTEATLIALREKRWDRTGFKTFDTEALSWENVAKEWLETLPQLAGIKEPAILEKTPDHTKHAVTNLGAVMRKAREDSAQVTA